MKKKIKKFESPAVTHNEADLWQDLTKRTAEKFARVTITTSNPHINVDKFRHNFDLIDWGHGKQT